MAGAPHLLPAELWINIFRFLPPADLFSVRACCKRFKKLADLPFFWKRWTLVVSSKNASCNSGFWSSLRRREVRGVALRTSKVKDWEKLVANLPQISTLIMDQTTHGSLYFLWDLPHLSHLIIIGGSAHIYLDSMTLFNPLLLTRLSVCGSVYVPSCEALVSMLSKFSNLTSLIFHGNRSLEPWMIYSLLSYLPKLKHLSMSCGITVSRTSTEPPGEWPLPSLELIDYVDGILPESTLQPLQGLASLGIFFKRQNTGEGLKLLLTGWLKNLSNLSTLVISRGPPVDEYTSSIPASITSLTLSDTTISLKNLRDLAYRIPNLLHLHVDSSPICLGAKTVHIARLFPNLKTLRIRHRFLSESDLKVILKLPDLKHLQILDYQPELPRLIERLKAHSQNRVIIDLPSETNLLSCSCVEQVSWH